MGWDNRDSEMRVLRKIMNNTVPSKIAAHTREIARYAVEKATEFSPFLSGRFMASWRISRSENVGDAAPVGKRSSEYEAATESVDASMQVIAHLKMGQTFYLGNNVPYADLVEFGGSNNFPHYITRRVTQSIGGTYGRIYI